MKFSESVLPVTSYSSVDLDPSLLDTVVPQFIRGKSVCLRTHKQTFTNYIICLERNICLFDEKKKKKTTKKP